ncbi:MAG: hypothetical protein EB168_08700 [Euryarchaeota archaeon]|nr:hypothetical protein [Euryarchaeota archaeon]
MPNWCNNTITIQGPTDTIKPLWETAKQEGLLQAIKPMPKELEGTTSPAPREGTPQPLVDGFDNWYDWRVANWGTKWDVDTEGLEYTDNGDGTSSIAGYFESAWSPPIDAYQTFCDDMDNCSLDAYYDEGGMDFAGHWYDGVDDFCDNVSEYARNVIKNGDSGSDLYDHLDDCLELTEQRREYIEEELNEEAQKVHDFVVEKQAVNGKEVA